jgi:hypothetical protein
MAECVMKFWMILSRREKCTPIQKKKRERPIPLPLLMRLWKGSLEVEAEDYA